MTIEWKGESFDCGDGNHNFTEWEDWGDCEWHRYCDGNDYTWYYSLETGEYFKRDAGDYPGDGYVSCGGLYCEVAENRYDHQWGELQEDENGRLVRICENCGETTYEQKADHTWGPWYVERRVNEDEGTDGVQARICSDPDCNEKQTRKIEYKGGEFNCGEGNHVWGEWHEMHEYDDPCLKQYRYCYGNDKEVFFVGGEDIDDVRYVEVSDYSERPEGSIWCGGKYCNGYEEVYEHTWGDLEVVAYPSEDGDGLMARFCEVCDEIDPDSERVIKCFGERTCDGDHDIRVVTNPEEIKELIGEENYSDCIGSFEYCRNRYDVWYDVDANEYVKQYHFEGEDAPENAIYCGSMWCDHEVLSDNHEWGNWETIVYPDEDGEGCDGKQERHCQKCDQVEERGITWFGEIGDCTKSGLFGEHNWGEWTTREDDPEYIQLVIDEEGLSKCLVAIRYCVGHDVAILFNSGTGEYVPGDYIDYIDVYDGDTDAGDYIYCGYIYCYMHDAKYDHDWGEWKVTKKATTSETGTEERVCKRCEAKETREIPKLKTESTMPKTGVETIPTAALQVSSLISAIGYALLKRRSLHR